MKLVALVLFAAVAITSARRAAAAPPRVAFETSKGAFVVELDAERSPATVESFLDNVDSGFYTGTTFHRVVPGFVVQGGGEDARGVLKPTDKALANEADNGLLNERGTVAMARKGDPHSASVQFFVNLADNAFLDHRDRSAAGWGYAVFGRVVEGMGVVDAIAAVPTGPGDRPLEPVVIESARRLEAPADEAGAAPES